MAGRAIRSVETDRGWGIPAFSTARDPSFSVGTSRCRRDGNGRPPARPGVFGNGLGEGGWPPERHVDTELVHCGDQSDDDLVDHIDLEFSDRGLATRPLDDTGARTGRLGRQIYPGRDHRESIVGGGCR